MSDFVGTNLRLIRLFHDLSLTELGERVGVSKQFLSRVETGAESVAAPLENSLAQELDVLPEFFYHLDPNPIADEQCHFRRQLTTKVVLRQVARARGEMLKRLVGVLDEHVELPHYQVGEADPESPETIERAAEKFRSLFSLGLGPLSRRPVLVAPGHRAETWLHGSSTFSCDMTLILAAACNAAAGAALDLAAFDEGIDQCGDAGLTPPRRAASDAR